MSDKILKDLQEAVVKLDIDASVAAAKAAMAAGIDPVVAIEQGLAAGMNKIVDLFDEAIIFMPDILIAAEAFGRACDILQENLSKEDAAAMSNGKVLFFSVAGDIHDIGKKIVKTMFQANNFEVKDLGRDVDAETLVDAAMEWKPDIVAGSALMTTTMPASRDVINLMIERGVRDQFKVMLGGAPLTKAWCDEIGADAYGENAAEAVKVALELMS